MSSVNKFWQMTIIHGVVLFALLTGFFLLMRVLDLAQVFYLRTLNVVFVFLVLNSVIVRFRKKSGVRHYEDFFDFFKIAFRAGMIGVLLFAGFLAVYLDQLDPAFMERLQELENQGGLLTPVAAAFIIILEGAASVIIVSFIIIQLKKARTVEKPEREPASLDEESKKHR